jgi:hypothetical protein
MVFGDSPKKDESFEFTFNPAKVKQYDMNVRDQKQIQVGDGKQDFESIHQSTYKVISDEGKFTFNNEVSKSVTLVNGVEFTDNPLLQAMQKVPTTLVISEHGVIEKIRGYHSFWKGIKKNLNSHQIKALGPIISGEAMNAKVIKEWGDKIGYWLGKSFLPDSYFKVTKEKFEILPGLSVPYASVMTLSKPYEVEGDKLVDINFKFGLHLEDFKGLKKDVLESIMNLEIKPSKFPQLKIKSLNGTQKYVVEVDSMLYWSETTKIKVECQVYAPAGWVDSSVIQNRTVDYLY